MNIKHGRSGAAALAVIVGSVLLAGCGGKDSGAPSAAAPPASTAAPLAPTREQLLSATVTGPFATPVTLASGRYDGPPAQPGAASHPTLLLMQPTVLFGELDGAPPNEAVALLASSEGGSGETTHVAVFAMRDGQAQSVATAPVGDRVKLFRLWLERDQIHMDVIEPAAGEPACCPTQLTRKAYGLKDGKLAVLESAPVGALSINLLAATDWMLVEMDGQPLPQGVIPPTTLIQYGKATGFAGCNRYNGPIAESKPGSIKVGALVTTKKACDAPAMDLEAKFLDRMAKADSYTFQAGQLLLSGPPDAQGARPDAAPHKCSCSAVR